MQGICRHDYPVCAGYIFPSLLRPQSLWNTYNISKCSQPNLVQNNIILKLGGLSHAVITSPQGAQSIAVMCKKICTVCLSYSKRLEGLK